MALYKNNKLNPDDPPWYQQIVNAITTAVTGTPEGYEKTEYVNPDGTPQYVKIGTTSNRTKQTVNNKIGVLKSITNPENINNSSYISIDKSGEPVLTTDLTYGQTNKPISNTPVATSQTPVTTPAAGTPKKKKPLAQTKGNAIFVPPQIDNEQYLQELEDYERANNVKIFDKKNEYLTGVTTLGEGPNQVMKETPLGTTTEQYTDLVVNEEVPNTKTDLELAIDELMKNYEKNQKDKKIALAGKYGKDNLMTMLEFIRNERQGLPEDVPTPVMRTPDLIDTTSADMAMLQKKEAEGYSAIREIGNATGNLEMIKSASASLNSDVMNNVINLAKQKQANINTQRTMATEVANKNTVAATETKKLNLERIGVANDKTGAIRSQLLSQFGKMDADYVANKFKLRNQDQNQKVFKLLLDQYRAHAGEQAYLDLVAQYGLSGVEAERTVVAPNSAAAEEKQEGGK